MAIAQENGNPGNGEHTGRSNAKNDGHRSVAKKQEIRPDGGYFATVLTKLVS
jgi:hypothetical protein